jgi:hypothetical protein
VRVDEHQQLDVLERLPASFLDVAYVDAKYPGAHGADGIEGGANCQLFAFEVLRYFGLEVPPLRSSELWEDSASTAVVEQPAPLDLLLFNRTHDAWGAHVGVFVGDERVLHLAKSVGRPAVWNLSDFVTHPEYRVLVGIKRVRSSS